MDNPPKVCFYTGFMGSDSNKRNVIHHPPTHEYDCYYMSNNTKTLETAYSKGWKCILITEPSMAITDNYTESSMQAKFIKSMTHVFPFSHSYDFSVYFDNKLLFSIDSVLNVIRNWNHEKAWFLKLHPYIYCNVWNEFNDAMHQERYAIQRNQYENYIHNQVAQGLMDYGERHFASGFIIRNHRHPKIEEMNKTWYNHILECGIECQISLFFIYQIFKEYIDFEVYDGSIVFTNTRNWHYYNEEHTPNKQKFEE